MTFVKSKSTTFVTFFIMFIFFCNFAFTQEKDESIYQIYSTDKTFYPHIAVDEDSGTTGIVWTAYNKYTGMNRRVMFAHFYKDKSDIWQVSKPKVAGGGGEYATICFNSNEKKFLIAWHSGEWWESLIRSRFYNIKGKPKGGIINYDRANLPNKYPLVMYNNNENNFLLVWCRGQRSILNPASSGLMTVVLNSYGQFSSTPQSIRSVILSRNYQWPTEPISGVFNNKSKRFFIIVRENRITNYYNNFSLCNYFLYDLDERGNLYKKKKLNIFEIDRDYFSWYAEISNNESSKRAKHIVTWQDSEEVYYQVVDKKGRTKLTTTGLDSDGVLDTTAAYSPDLDQFLIVYRIKKGLRGFHIDSSGIRIEQNSFKVTKTSNASRPNAAWNPILKKFLVIWVERTTRAHDNVYLSLID